MPSPVAALRTRLRSSAGRWARRRQGTDALPVRLVARRIYILPTRAGMGCVVALLGLLFGGLNYGNSLALLLAFLLGSLGAVAMFQCHRRLLDVRILAVAMQPAFAGDPIALAVTLDCPDDGRDARDIRIRASRAPAPGGPWAHFAAQGAPTVAIAYVDAGRAPRGPWRFPRLRLEQRAPFGLFQAWAWLHLDGGGLVWPRPQGARALPLSAGDQRGAELAVAGLDEWAGLRPFRDGDSPRQVAWKAYARGAPLLVREYHDARGSERLLDFAQLGSLDVEARLSQLAMWVVDAERDGDRWALRLPAETLPVGSGAAHRRACLDALARHGFPARGESPA